MSSTRGILPKGFVRFLRDGPSVSLDLGQQLCGEGTAQMGLCVMEKTGRCRHSTALCSDLWPGLCIESQALGKAAEANGTKGADSTWATRVQCRCWRGRVNHTAAAALRRQTWVSQTHQDLCSCLLLLPFHRNWQLGSWALKLHLSVPLGVRNWAFWQCQPQAPVSVRLGWGPFPMTSAFGRHPETKFRIISWDRTWHNVLGMILQIYLKIKATCENGFSSASTVSSGSNV